MDAPGGTTPDGGAMWLENVPRASSNVASSSRRRSSVPLPHHRPRTALQDPSLAAPSLSASASSTSTRYVSQPSRGVSAYPPSPGPVSPTLASTSAFAHDPLSAPLPAPVPIPIAIEGRGSTRGPEGVLSPPTPVPSPRTERRRDQSDGGERPRTLSGMDASRADELRQLMGDDRAEGDMSALGEGLSKMWSDRRADASELLNLFGSLPTHERYAFLTSLIPELRMNEALIVSRRIEPFLRRDMLRELPTELALHCMSFINDAATLTRAARVSRYWNALLEDEHTWREMCTRHRFKPIISPINARATASRRGSYQARQQAVSDEAEMTQNRSVHQPVMQEPVPRVEMASPTFKQQYKNAFLTQANWLHGGRVLKDHISAAESVVTTVAMNAQYLVVGMATPALHVFDTATCTWLKSLEGHQAGVWAINIITPHVHRSASGIFNDDGTNHGRSEKKQSVNGRGPKFRNFAQMKSGDPMGEVRGWGSRRTLVVSGGGDRDLRVWKLETGECVYALQGHTSTIRCLRVLDRLPICVTGSRDGSLRVWDLQKGEQRHVMLGHTQSVRCLDIAGNLCVSGSYDGTARVWDVMTGRLIHVLQGHFERVYSVIFQWDSPESQPARIITGSFDASVRIWDAISGECLALLQGHTALVGQMQVIGNHLVTGGSDGRVILYDLASYECLHRICAHDNSITAMHFDERYILSASNDGRIKLWDTRTGDFIRELSMPSEGIWRLAVKDDRVYIFLSRERKTVIEFLTFRPEEVE